MTVAEPRFQPLERDECLALLCGSTVGRVIYTDRALPAVRPVTFVVDGECVAFRTTASSRLAAAAAGAVVALEVDELDVELRSGWSVIVTGVATVVEPGVDRDRLVARLVPWAPGDRDCVVRIPITLLAGRRIVSSLVNVPSAGENGRADPEAAGALA